jgi:ATP-dependent Clp protease ATP-binding subunit ClpC
MSLFERFTDNARRTIVVAQEEARALDHDQVGTEHLLLGILRVDDDLATATGLEPDPVRQMVREVTLPKEPTPQGRIPFRAESKRALELALRESLGLGHDSIDTGHLLLGVIRNEECTAAEVLAALDVDLADLRRRVLGHLRTRVAVAGEPGTAAVRMPATTIDRFGRQLARIDRRLAAIEKHLGIGSAEEGERP